MHRPSLPARALHWLQRQGRAAGLPPEAVAPSLLVRQATAARRALPSFLIIGTQKGGTTSLYADLGTHPGVLPSIEKEVHYFDHLFYRGEAWYRRHFPLRSTLRGRGAITGEASPSYLYHPLVPERIAGALPDVKMIALLRNPVTRAVSQYWHMVREGKEPLPIEEAFAREAERLEGERARLSDPRYFSEDYFWHSYRHRGLYAEQLERYYARFDRSQLLVLRFEDFKADHQATYDAVLRFLDLPPHTLSPQPPRNVGEYKEETPPALKEELEAYFQPHNQRLYDLLSVAAPWW